jgi:hypothetical protein
MGGGLFPQEQTDRNVKLTSHLHLASKARKVDLYLHSPVRLHGIVFNYITKFRDKFTFYTLNKRQKF